MRPNRPLPKKTGPRLSFILRLVIRSDPVVVAIHALWVRFLLVSLLESLDPLPGYWNRHPRPIELSKMVGPVVVGACHHIRPEPRPREFPHCLVLVVEAIVIDQNPVTFLDFLRP